MKYHLGSWFPKLWSIVKGNNVLLDEFIRLFEHLIQNHEEILFMEIHSNGLFIDVLETYYYGSHITTEKIQLLFEHILELECFFDSLDKIRDSMRLYKIKTG